MLDRCDEMAKLGCRIKETRTRVDVLFAVRMCILRTKTELLLKINCAASKFHLRIYRDFIGIWLCLNKHINTMYTIFFLIALIQTKY
jgi:hypothetical protein